MPQLPAVGLLVLLASFWLVMTVAWAPILAARSARRLFSDWPTGSLFGNYGFGMAAFTFVHFLALAVSLAVVGGESGLNLMEWFQLAIGVTVALLALAWVGLSFGLPHLGRWRPTGDGFDGRLVLAVGGAWYLVCSILVVALLNMIAFVLWFPG